jgi:hypothetical protein
MGTHQQEFVDIHQERGNRCHCMCPGMLTRPKGHFLHMVCGGKSVASEVDPGEPEAGLIWHTDGRSQSALHDGTWGNPWVYWETVWLLGSWRYSNGTPGVLSTWEW